MSLAIDNIVSQLPAMDVGDLTKIKQLTEMLLGGQAEVAFTSDDERILFQSIQAELSSQGIRCNVSHAAVAAGRTAKSWKRSVMAVTQFLDTSFKGYAKTEIERLGLCRIFVQALIKELKYRGIPVSIGTIALNLHRVQQVFDRAFPSYIEAGLAHLIPKAMLRSTARN